MITWVCACLCVFVRYVFVTPGFALLFHSLPQGGRVSTEHMDVEHIDCMEHNTRVDPAPPFHGNPCYVPPLTEH